MSVFGNDGASMGMFGGVRVSVLGQHIDRPKHIPNGRGVRIVNRELLGLGQDIQAILTAEAMKLAKSIGVTPEEAAAIVMAVQKGLTPEKVASIQKISPVATQPALPVTVSMFPDLTTILLIGGGVLLLGLVILLMTRE